MDPDYAAKRAKHSKEVAQAINKNGTTEAVNLSRAAVFEQVVPTPVSPT
jgi:hypothetical protein